MSDEFTETDETPTEADLDQLYGSKYLSSNDVGKNKIRTKVMKVRKEELRDGDSGKKKIKFIIFFESIDKPLVLNATNKDALVDALGKPPANWIGATVGLYVDPNVPYAGRRVKGLRLRVLLPPAAAAKPVPKPAPAPAVKPPAADVSAWPEEKGDPGFDPDDFNDGLSDLSKKSAA
jgi:hypothetical protein